MEYLDFGFRSIFSSADDGTGVTHASTRRSGSTGDKSSDRFLAVRFDPASGFDFSTTTDFTNHDNRFGFRIFVKEFNHIEVRGAIDGVATNAHAGGLSVSLTCELPYCFVGEGARAGNNANFSAFVNVTRGDADTAATMRFITTTRSDDAWAVRSD